MPYSTYDPSSFHSRQLTQPWCPCNISIYYIRFVLNVVRLSVSNFIVFNIENKTRVKATVFTYLRYVLSVTTKKIMINDYEYIKQKIICI